MENIFFLVVVAVVVLAQLAMRVAEARKNAQAKKQSAPPVTNAPILRSPAESEEERVRKFFEALGVPTASTPPPRVQPRQVAPKKPRSIRKIMPVDPFPVPRAGRPFPPVIAGAPSIPPPLIPPSPSSPLPTRETSVVADSPAPKTPPQRTDAEFEVRDIGENMADGLPPSISPREAARAPDPSKPQTRSIVARLATAEGLRDAMVLREIFGPPRSMQPLEQTAAALSRFSL